MAPPRRHAGSTPPHKKATARTPPSKSLPFDPRNGKFGSWSAGPPLSAEKTKSVCSHIPLLRRVPVRLPRAAQGRGDTRGGGGGLGGRALWRGDKTEVVAHVVKAG